MGINLELIRVREDKERESKYNSGLGRNIATARNEIDLSKLCENTSRMGLDTSLCLLTLCTLCLTEPRTNTYLLTE